MSGFLVDTNVVSEFIRPEPDRQVVEWFKALDPETAYVSVITYGEILLGIENLPIGKRRATLQQWFDEGLPQWFQTHLLPVRKSTMDRWARLTVEARKRGITVATTDGLIAATALEYDLTVITRDQDFDGLDVKLVNPWPTPPQGV